MPDVFINYRTGDEELAATLLEHDMSARFGEEKVFRASRSIAAGEPFPQRILGAVHGSHALLAVIGPRWADARDDCGGQRLADEADWVRRELLEARKFDVRVIPVLVGGDSLKLNVLTLPDELSWLRDLQYRRLTSRDDRSNLDRIAADLMAFVPGLTPVATERPPAPSTVHGNVTTIHDNHGQVHSGTGPQYNGPFVDRRGSDW